MSGEVVCPIVEDWGGWAGDIDITQISRILA